MSGHGDDQVAVGVGRRVRHVGFFSDRATITAIRDEEARPVQPEWLGPPADMIGGYAPTRAVLFRTERAVLSVGRFDAYPTGVVFTLELRLRVPDIDFIDVPWERHGRRGGRSSNVADDDEFLRLGVAFADGASWSNIDVSSTPRPDRPAGPIVISQGGGGGGDGWRMDQWLWPLPPPGALIFFVEWPAFDVGETSTSVDTGELHRAAQDAQRVWPDP